MAVKKESIEKDNRELIAAHLNEIERDLAWLSRKTGIPYGTLYYCIVRRQFRVTPDNLKKINSILQTEIK